MFARFIISLNFLLPILSWIFIFEDKSPELNECLGKGYLNFKPQKVHLCSNENQLIETFCWTWLSLLSILMSDVIDVFCIFWFFKDINKATEESRNMLSNQGFFNRKRYDQMFCLKNLQHLLTIPYLIIFRDNGITIQIMTFQLYIELILFLVTLLFGIFLPYSKLAGILGTFLIFVVQPLFYLNGDVNFRNRVQNQGLWKALEKELFQMN